MVRANLLWSTVGLSLLGLVNAIPVRSSVPGPDSLGTDVAILTHNDLYGQHSTRDESLLVLHTWQSASSAASACQGLGESLWNPSTADFLPYLGYEGKTGLYHAANGMCANITKEGLGGVTDNCSGEYPAFCTNSAPYANATHADNTTYWQVQVKADQQTSFTGYRTKDAFVFQGIRYAEPFNRFEYSQVSNATGNIEALAYQSQCVQAGNVGSEDCLFLNVWTPFLPTGGKPDKKYLKPVMFQIHGGGFTGGTGADPSLAGVGLSSRGDVVVVTINYRLTTLGFLALDDGVTNGNYGLADQITALQWVNKYIASFGGDPDRVTIFGQSAGAGSVRALLGSPPAIGLFSGAIMESNLDGFAYASTYSQYYTIDQEVKAAADPILNATGCLNSTDQLSCLRGVSPYLLANLTTSARYLVIDGTYLVRQNLAVDGQGPAANVPVMIGFMRDDGASFIGFPKEGSGVNNVSAELGSLGFPASALTPAILDLYPIPFGNNASLNLYNASAALATDTEFRCLDESTAYSAVKNGVWPKAYVFTFNRTYGGYDPNPPVCEAPIDADHPFGNPDAEYFKCHSGELQYVFGGLGYTGQPDRDGLDIPMSQMTLDRWTAFARTYDPNPEPAFLDSRGFTNTSLEMSLSGNWAPIDTSDSTSLKLRVFQWPSFEAPFDVFSSVERCEAFGFGIDFYERNPDGYSLTA